METSAPNLAQSGQADENVQQSSSIKNSTEAKSSNHLDPRLVVNKPTDGSCPHVGQPTPQRQDVGEIPRRLGDAAPEPNVAIAAAIDDANSNQWSNYAAAFKIFGPLMTIVDITDKSAEAGFLHYDSIQREALSKIARYAFDFLAKPHEDLGREGPVCPFVPTALKNRLLKATSTRASDLSEVEAGMKMMGEVFANMSPISPPNGTAEGEQIFKAIIVAFPLVSEETAPRIIDGLQKRLKPAYIRRGQMIGQFHPLCPEPGLHNPDFRPLQSPVPSLTIRHITKHDAPFMIDENDYLEGYLERFGDEGRRRIEAFLEKKAADLCPSRLQEIQRVSGI